MYRNELYHHGIKGQKWGVRRYRNPDGTLTKAGQKHYYNMSSKNLHRALTKEIRKQRAQIHGGSNRWMHNKEIGPNSDQLRSYHESKLNQYLNSKEYKQWDKGYDKLDKKLQKQVDSGQIDYSEYDRLIKDYVNKRPKQDWETLSYAKIYGKTGVRYANDFLNKGGKSLSIARLKDLGYSEDVAKKFVDQMIKQGYTLGDI